METGALGSVLPGPGQVIVVVSEVGLTVADARAVAALASSGKEVAVVTGAILSDEVLAWLPKDGLYKADEPQRSGWTVSDGLVTLTPDEEDLWNERILEPIQAKDAESLAAVLSQVSVGVAWDRPIFVPATRQCDGGILNADAYDRFPIRGLRDEEYLRFEDDEVTGMWRTDTNPLCVLGWSRERYVEFNSVLTLNVLVGGVPSYLSAVPTSRLRDAMTFRPSSFGRGVTTCTASRRCQETSISFRDFRPVLERNRTVWHPCLHGLGLCLLRVATLSLGSSTHGQAGSFGPSSPGESIGSVGLGKKSTPLYKRTGTPSSAGWRLLGRKRMRRAGERCSSRGHCLLSDLSRCVFPRGKRCSDFSDATGLSAQAPLGARLPIQQGASQRLRTVRPDGY